MKPAVYSQRVILLALTVLATTASPAERLGQGARQYAEGDYAGARSTLAPLLTAKLATQDYALWFFGQAADYSGDRAGALDAFHRLAASKSRLASLGAWREADLLFALGRNAEAARAYEALVKHAVPGGDVAVACYHMAEAAQAAGRKDVAALLFRRVYVEQPGHPLAEVAYERLATLSGGTPVITPDERVRRANTLSASRQWEAALSELQLVPKDAPTGVREEADLALGMTRYKTRHDYRGAAEALLGVFERLGGERASLALFHGARALSRADEDDRAIEYYHEVVRRYPHSRWAAEAQFLIGWLEFNRGRYQAALPGLTDLLARYPKSEFADDASWYLGFSLYLLGRLDEAAGHFERVAREPKEYVRAKGRYWAARVLDRRGLAPQAVAAYKAIVTDHPLTWYGLLAQARLQARGAEVGPFGLAGHGDAPLLSAPDPRLLGEPALVRADELLAAGLDVEAGEELRQAEHALVHRYTAPRTLPALLERYRRAANWNRVYLLGEAYSGRSLRLPPVGEGRKWWEAAYPLAYRDLIEKYAALGQNPDYYLFAIMRKESAFNPHDVSYADAIGLLQMIPPTSRRVAERIHIPYTDDVLYDPAGNIQFGSWYIGHLLSKFKRQVPLGAGAFNAGPRPMMRWIEKHGQRPMDEFVELCAYTQTREYMKLVTDNYAHYLYLYGGKVYRQSLVVDPKWLDDGIEY
jgi:soluble lytic murein transglycosylase